jgi:SPP1 gp7 family putative phage head morphogenesis protein
MPGDEPDDGGMPIPPRGSQPPDPEQEIIKVEKATRPDIQAALEKQLDHIKAAGEQFHDIQTAIDSLPSNDLTPAIQRTVIEGASAGVNIAFVQLQDLGIGVNWGLANHSAAEWARNYAFGLVNGINGTSRNVLQSALTDWINSGEPLSVLHDQLTPWFGEARAQMIASTETTRSYAEGSRAIYRGAGLSKVIILTNNDEIVCPICGPLNDKVVPLDSGDATYGFPPFHPRCRCLIAPFVERSI